MGKVRKNEVRNNDSHLSRNEQLRQRVIKRLMRNGNAAKITQIVDKALEISKTTDKLDKIFELCAPNKIVKPVIIAGAKKQIPVEPSSEQQDKVVAKNIKTAVKKSVSKGMNSIEALAKILEDGLNGTGQLQESKKAMDALAQENIAYSTYRFSR
jgi:ribosomal protein S7